MINKSIPKGSKSTEGYITTLSRIKPLAPAFSLMEMMVVMLVVAVVMAIAAPMVTKKLSNYGGGSGASLLTSVAGGNVAFNLKDDNRAIIYGGNDTAIDTMSDYLEGGASSMPRLILSGKASGENDENAQIGFMYSTGPEGTGPTIGTGTMLLGNNNRIYIGNKTKIALTVNNTIAIGSGIDAPENSILIGRTSSSSSGASSVAIGDNVRTGASSVTLGSGASSSGGGVAIGTSTSAGSGVAIGYASAGSGVAIAGKYDSNLDKTSGGGYVAIGTNTQASGGIALGHGANAHSSCDAIGQGAKCDGSTNNEHNEAFYLGGRSNIIFSAGGSLSASGPNDISFRATDGVTFTSSVSVPSKPENSETGLYISKVFSPSSLSANIVIGGPGGISGSSGNFENIDKRFEELEKLMEDLDLESLYENYNRLLAAIEKIDYEHEDITVIHTTIYQCKCSKSDSGLAKFAFWRKNTCETNCCQPNPMLAYNYMSDKRLKDIIGENLDAMDKVNRLKVYDFTFKDDEAKTKHVGVIAQELKKVFSNAVEEGEDGFLRIRHEDIFYAMVNSLKDLSARIKKITQNLPDNVKLLTDNSETISKLQTSIKAKDEEIRALNKELIELEKLVSKLAKE